MSAPTNRPDDAFPTYRSDTAERDRTRRRVRQVTALLGVSAAIGTGAFTVGLAMASAPATTAATVTSSTPAPAQPPTTLTRYVSDDGDDGGWHRVVQGTTTGQQAPTSGSVGSVTTTGGSTAVAVP